MTSSLAFLFWILFLCVAFAVGKAPVDRSATLTALDGINAVLEKELNLLGGAALGGAALRGSSLGLAGVERFASGVTRADAWSGTAEEVDVSRGGASDMKIELK